MDEIKRQLTCYNGTQVTIKQNDLSNIIEDVFDELMKHKDTLYSLEFTHCHLTYIPDSIGQFTNLKQFICTENQFESLPDSIGNLINLTSLYICLNKIEYLPESICNLINLENFSCSQNNLKLLPESLGNLTKLIYFWCYENQIKFLPQSMKFLENMVYLYCDIDEIQNLDRKVYLLYSAGHASKIIKWMQKNYNPMVKSACKT